MAYVLTLTFLGNCWFTIVLNDGKHVLHSVLILVHRHAVTRPSGLLFIWSLKSSVSTVINNLKNIKNIKPLKWLKTYLDKGAANISCQ